MVSLESSALEDISFCLNYLALKGLSCTRQALLHPKAVRSRPVSLKVKLSSNRSETSKN